LLGCIELHRIVPSTGAADKPDATKWLPDGAKPATRGVKPAWRHPVWGQQRVGHGYPGR
jgi:hypothetical protein